MHLVILGRRMEDICSEVWCWRGVARAMTTDSVIVRGGGDLHVGAGVVVEGSKTMAKSSGHL
jgi:hypothetical protein